MSDLPLSDVVDSEITVEDVFPSRLGFGTPLILAYHARFVGRVQVYSDLADVQADWGVLHPVYFAAQRMFAQKPTRPPTIKVGKRTATSAQTIRLTPINVTVGFVYLLRIGGVLITYTVVTGDSVSTICTALTAALNASTLAAAVAGVVTPLATMASPQTITRANINGTVGGDFVVPRKLTITRSTNGSQSAVSAVLTYLDEYQQLRTDTFAFASGGGDTFTSSHRASRFISLAIPSQGGTGGTTEIGVTALATPTNNTTNVDVAAPNDGTYLGYQFDGTNKSADITLQDNTALPGTSFQTDLAAIQALDADFYGVDPADANSSAQIADAEVWIEANNKMMIAASADSAVASSSSVTDIAYTSKDTSIGKTAILYHRNAIGLWPESAWLGRCLPLTPGTETWALKTLALIPTDDLSGAELAALQSKNCNCYVKTAGIGVTFGSNGGGTMASGRFIDLARFVDALNAAISEDASTPLFNNDKIPFTDKGITPIVAEVRKDLTAAPLGTALSDQILNVPKVADIPAPDRAARRLTGMSWSATYNGAVHSAKITGRIGVGGTP